MLTIALSKGKLIDSALELFRRAGYTITGLSGDSRRLIFVSRENDMTFLIVRPSDVRPMWNMVGQTPALLGKTS
jgi:ATP phosphoribosyltransferase